MENYFNPQIHYNPDEDFKRLQELNNKILHFRSPLILSINFLQTPQVTQIKRNSKNQSPFTVHTRLPSTQRHISIIMPKQTAPKGIKRTTE